MSFTGNAVSCLPFVFNTLPPPCVYRSKQFYILLLVGGRSSVVRALVAQASDLGLIPSDFPVCPHSIPSLCVVLTSSYNNTATVITQLHDLNPMQLFNVYRKAGNRIGHGLKMRLYHSFNINLSNSLLSVCTIFNLDAENEGVRVLLMAFHFSPSELRRLLASASKSGKGYRHVHE